MRRIPRQAHFVAVANNPIAVAFEVTPSLLEFYSTSQARVDREQTTLSLILSGEPYRSIDCTHGYCALAVGIC